MSYASGKHAYGICDRTGFRYPLEDLVYEFQDGHRTGFRVGKDVVDPDQPQNFLGRIRVVDPQSLLDPRPDASPGRGLFGWNPVGHTLVHLTGQVGSVTLDIPVPESNTVTGVAASGSVGTVSVLAGSSANVSVTGVAGTNAVGTVSITAVDSSTVSATGIAGTGASGAVTVTTNIFAVTVASGTNPYGTGNKFYIDGVVSPTISIAEGSTFRFDQSASSNSSHPLRFSTTANGTHGGGSEYTTGVTTSGTAGQAGAYVQITVANSAPTLYYYCTNHSGMGGTANTP
tara:strand:+ start:351 stop:1211 length:861 start_codon:yes stop_codon:yes gene_type:complete